MFLFDRDISLTEEANGRFAGRLSENWSINGNPNGGYIMALVACAMGFRSQNKTPVILTANYLNKCVSGPVSIATEHIASGRRLERWQARLYQEDQAKLLAMGTFCQQLETDTEARCETSPPEIAERDQCVYLPRIGEYTLFDQVTVLLDPASAGWLEQRYSDRSEMKGWIRFSDGRPYDALSLALVADAYPPPVYASQGFLAWVPTIEFSINIRTLPGSEWLKCVFRSEFIDNGFVCEDGEVWDENGQIVMVTRQIAQFRKRS